MLIIDGCGRVSGGGIWGVFCLDIDFRGRVGGGGIWGVFCLDILILGVVCVSWLEVIVDLCCLRVVRKVSNLEIVFLFECVLRNSWR